VRFTIAGAVADEPYYRRCLTLRHRLGLDDVVAMGEASSDVARVYRSADVILLTSISEAFPYSVLEAMSCGRAVVASDVGGVGEALEGCGVLVKPRDEESFAVELRRLLDDPALRRRLGEAARARVLDDFQLDRNIVAHVALYQDLAGEAA
jgi:glycosyltransferase involved in cell wall biosynthesis